VKDVAIHELSQIEGGMSLLWWILCNPGKAWV